MELIQTVTVGSGGAASMVFGTGGTLPITYDDLYLVVSSRTSNTGTCALFISFNGSTSNFSSSALEGNGSSASSFTLARFIGGTNGSGTTSNTFTSVETYIPNYRSSVAKSYSANNANENNATEAFQTIIGGLWNDTAPITSLTVTPQLGNFVEGSSASLYGIRKFNTSAQPKATGGAISFDAVNNKWVHVFSTSGTFTPTANITCEYLVVAGGAGGGFARGGGGGAGGYRSSVAGQPSGGGGSAESALSLLSGTGYTVTIGAGGVAGSVGSRRGGNGSDSVFSTITSTGGGGGGGAISGLFPGASGGSGGGGNGGVSGGSSGGAGTTNQGYAGGNSGVTGDGTGGGGGGGGAASVGANGVTTTLGVGGTGLSSSITGTSLLRAAGGDGGSGTGSEIKLAGGANTGSGGGGGAGGGATDAQAGGSGIVIVRYDA